MNRGFFITGTDTGVGKTVIASAIIKALHAQGINACGMKPIETGCTRIGNNLYPSDGMFLKKVAGMNENIKYITPYCFETPVAPSLASEMEGKSVNINVIMQKFNSLLKRYNATVVEGVGGLLVPIKKDYFVIDLIRELKLPLIVVSRPSLGTLNHTLLTVNYALREDIKVSGIIINFSRPPDGNISEETNPYIIQKMSPVPVIGIFPYLSNLGDEILERNALKYLSSEIFRKQLSNPSKP